MLESKATDGGIRHGERRLMITVPEAARLLGIGTTLCWEMVKAGELPSHRFGRRVVIPRAAIERLAQTGDASSSR